MLSVASSASGITSTSLSCTEGHSCLGMLLFSSCKTWPNHMLGITFPAFDINFSGWASEKFNAMHALGKPSNLCWILLKQFAWSNCDRSCQVVIASPTRVPDPSSSWIPLWYVHRFILDVYSCWGFCHSTAWCTWAGYWLRSRWTSRQQWCEQEAPYLPMSWVRTPDTALDVQKHEPLTQI